MSSTSYFVSTLILVVMSVSFRCVTHHPDKAWTVCVSIGKEFIEGECSTGHRKYRRENSRVRLYLGGLIQKSVGM